MLSVVFHVTNNVGSGVGELRLMLVMGCLLIDRIIQGFVVVRVFNLVCMLSVHAFLDASAVMRHWFRRSLEKLQRFTFVLCRKT